MQFLETPNIGYGTPIQQIEQIKSYLYKNNEQLNSILNNLTIDKIVNEIEMAVKTTLNTSNRNTQFKAICDTFVSVIEDVLKNKLEYTFNEITTQHIFVKNSLETLKSGTRYFGATENIELNGKYLCFANGLFVGYKDSDS